MANVKTGRSAKSNAPAKAQPTRSKDSRGGVRFIEIPRRELAKDPFRYISDPPTMPGEKKVCD